MALATTDECLAYLNVTTDKEKLTYRPLVNLLMPFADRLVRKFVGYAIEQQTITEYHPFISSRPAMSMGFAEDEIMLAYEGSPQGARPIRQGRGNSRDVIRLNHLPIRSIVGVYEDPSAWLTASDSLRFSESTKLVESSDYHVDWDANDRSGNKMSRTGFIYRSGGIWSLQARSVKVVYVAGYTAEEIGSTTNGVDSGEALDFKMASLMTLAKLAKEAIAQGLGGPKTTGMIASESIDGYAVSYVNPANGVDVSLMNDLPDAAKRILASRQRMSQFV